MKAFFLDRDGVINESHSLNRPEDVRLLKGAGEAIRQLNKSGYEVFVVTNQGGVGLGYLSEEDLNEIHMHMVELIERTGGKIREIKACIHKPSHGCNCRKPKPGMILDLVKSYNIDLTQSFMVGDRDVDIQAGRAGRLSTIFIGKKKPGNVEPDYMFPSLYEAVTQLIAKGILK